MILRFITEDWRLKLLGLGLAILMLGSVAFAQNQPTTGSLDVGLNYVVTSPDIILINPPTKINVAYAGLADAVSKINTSTLTATVDTTGARPGSSVRLNVTPHSSIRDVTPQQPPPIVVNIDTRQLIPIPVQVNARPAVGWEIDPTKTLVTCPGAKYANPCQVQFDGPVAWESGLRAVTTVQGVAGQMNALGQPVALQAASNVDLSQRTVPNTHVDVTLADVHIEAATGATTESVPLLDASPRPPPSGYRITAVTITPQFVTVTGDPQVLARVRNIVLPPSDLSRSTSDTTVPVTIPYPQGVIGDPQTATIKYSISANPNVSPTSSP
jgi:YbbR domain-containing protein